MKTIVQRRIKMLIYAVILLAVQNRHLVVSQNVTVELAIFCDLEFDEFFQHNETKIREYLAIRLFDANLRFRTLPSVDVKFVVTSLTIIKNLTDQPFIESDRDSNGHVSMDSVLQKFALWLRNYNGTKFDIALLSLGAITNDNYKSRAFIEGACRKTYIEGNIATAVARLERDDLWNGCGSIESALASVLGALNDQSYTNDDCFGKKFIKGKECSRNHYFFSSCSNRAILAHVRMYGDQCLDTIENPEPSVFNVTDLSVKPPSILEQFAIIE